MIQKKWFRIEHLKDGSLGEVTEVDTKGKAGSTIRFYEALTKADACKQAKDWYAAHKLRNNAESKRARNRQIDAGLCSYRNCPNLPLAGKRDCKQHRDQAAKRSAEHYQREIGNLPAVERPSAEEVYARDLARRNASQRRRGGSLACQYRVVLKKLDELSPGEARLFRAWLVSEITLRVAKTTAPAPETGQAKLPRSKKARIDWFEDKLSDKAAE